MFVGAGGVKAYIKNKFILLTQASSHKVNSDIFTFNLHICLLLDMIEMTWPWATAHVSWQFIGNNICDKWSYFTSEILSVLLKYSPRRRRDGDEPRLFPGVGSRSLHTPYHTNPASPPMLTVSRHVSDGWQCLEPRVQYSEKVLCKAWNSESRLSE